MHTGLDEYDWPICAAPSCRNHLREDELQRHICRRCEDRTRQQLRALPALHRRLDTVTALTRRVRPGGGASGSIHAPAPPNLAVLALTGPGGIAARLCAIEDAWRTAFGRRLGTWAGSPAQATPAHVTFLVINLDRAVERYDSVGQDVDEIGRLHGECEAALAGGPRPAKVPVSQCPAVTLEGVRCQADLTAVTNRHGIRCGACGARWDGFDGWRELRRAQDEAEQIKAALAAGRAA